MNVLRRSIFKSTPFSHSLFKPHRISKLFSLPFSTNNKKDQEIKKNNILTTNKIPWWKPITDELNTVPNMITCSRMVATPFLGYVILQEEYTMACAGLAVFGFSDWLDGYIARTYNQTSVLGTFLDPFADKILIMTLVAVEGWGGLLPMPLVGLILARDAGLIVGGFYIRGTTKPDDVPFFDTTQASALEVTPSMLSKFNTACQVGLLMSALTNAAWGYPGNDMVLGLCWLTGATTFGSGVDYFINRPIANVAGTTTTTESTTSGPPLSTKQNVEEKMEKIVTSHLDDCEWQQSEKHGNLRWKYLVDSTQVLSHGMSCGILKVPLGGELGLHHHSPQEIYLIRSGEGILLRHDVEMQKLKKDSIVYIPKNHPHGLRNTGSEPLEVMWIFPTDCWEEIQYIFES